MGRHIVREGGGRPFPWVPPDRGPLSGSRCHLACGSRPNWLRWNPGKTSINQPEMIMNFEVLKGPNMKYEQRRVLQITFHFFSTNLEWWIRVVFHVVFDREFSKLSRYKSLSKQVEDVSKKKHDENCNWKGEKRFIIDKHETFTKDKRSDWLLFWFVFPKIVFFLLNLTNNIGSG